jgi:PKD repeat protein
MTSSVSTVARWKLLLVGLLALTLSACLPIPIFEVTPTTAHAKEALTFDASGTVVSNVPEGTVAVGWSWDFGDGETTKGEVVTHTYAKAGTYNVELTVTDSAGRKATVKEPLVVKEAVVTTTTTETTTETETDAATTTTQ